VRVGYVLKHKIGHCPMEGEIYLLERAAGNQPRRALDLFYFDYGTDGQSANLFAEHLVRRHLRLHGWAEWLAAANDRLPGADRHRIVLEYRDRRPLTDAGLLMQTIPQQIDLTAAEDRLGAALLAEMGVPAGSRFICIHFRESGYWRGRKPEIGSDSDFRNANLDNAAQAMLAAAERGYYVIRLGALASRPLPVEHARIIDYTTRCRSEFMDVYLAARCSLMISTGSGIDTVSYLFRRPLLYLNLSSWGLEYLGAAQPMMFMFKQFRRDGRLMGFAEIVALGAQEFTVTKDFVAAGIALEEQSPDEITEAVTEMLDRLEGTHVPDAADQARRERIRAHIRNSPRYRDWQFDVPAAYLRKYDALL
jgi:putative glycosyltransferase (TIGR04372 family)